MGLIKKTRTNLSVICIIVVLYINHGKHYVLYRIVFSVKMQYSLKCNAMATTETVVVVSPSIFSSSLLISSLEELTQK